MRYKMCCPVVPGHLSLPYLSCHLLCDSLKQRVIISSSGVTSVTSSSPPSCSHSLFSGHLSFLWCVCPALLAPDWSPLKPPPCSDPGQSATSKPVSFLMAALPEGLIPARARGVSTGYPKFRLPVGQALAPTSTSRLTMATAEPGAGDTG